MDGMKWRGEDREDRRERERVVEEEEELEEKRGEREVGGLNSRDGEELQMRDGSEEGTVLVLPGANVVLAGGPHLQSIVRGSHQPVRAIRGLV
jgi:hypothetical protein